MSKQEILGYHKVPGTNITISVHTHGDGYVRKISVGGHYCFIETRISRDVAREALHAWGITLPDDDFEIEIHK